jgi:hypothetical protein
MKKIREIHLYLGCLFAPVLIFFAVTGAWQLFGLERGRKDHSYEPPRIVSILSGIHVSQRLPSGSGEDATPLKYFILAAAVGLVASSVLGIMMAFRFGRNRAAVVLCLAAGVVVPVALLLIYR